MNLYTRKNRYGVHSARIDLPGITPRCWKNGKRVKCSRKPKVRFVTPIVRKIKNKKSKSTCWKNGKKVKCSTLVPPMLRWLIKVE